MADVKVQATEIVKKLVRLGYTAYFAGGWVRDFLLGHPSADIDIATNAPPDRILDIFPRTILVGLSFGVVVVSVNGHQFEVSTFRRDIDYKDGRKPDRIELADPREDALRRDFTINGMFYDPIEDEIHDYVHGREDLERGIIRTIGDPYERFFEDRLRMIRAIRFASRFGFNIEPETQNAITENAESLFPAVALERIWQEFNKMSDAPRFGHALIEMHRLGLLPIIFPVLKNIHLKDIKQRLEVIDYFPSSASTVVKLLELFPEYSQKDALDILRSLKISNKDVNLAAFILQGRQTLLNPNLSNVDWVHFYAHPDANLSLQIEAVRVNPKNPQIFLKPHFERQEFLAEHIQRFQEHKPLITSNHLKEQGIMPGKHMGHLLKEAEKIAILYNINDPKEILLKLKQTPMWNI